MFVQNLREAFSVNIDGFALILEAARERRVKKVIYASTSTIYGDTLSLGEET